MPTADNEGRVTKLLDLLAHTPIDEDAMAVVRDLLYEDRHEQQQAHGWGAGGDQTAGQGQEQEQ